MSKKIVDAKEDSNGNISAVKFKGNKSFTSIDTAIGMAEKGQIENAVAVHPSKAKVHIRTKPDNEKKNNLDEMAVNGHYF